MKKFIILSAFIACATSGMAQQKPATTVQKLPCKVADIDALLEEYDKKVLSTSQYLLMDINADGVKDIIVRDSDLPSASYAVIVCKGGKLEVENFAYDGYDMLGYAKGGYSFYQHDDHMGEFRTWSTNFSRYQNGKEVMTGEHSISLTPPERGNEDEEANNSEEYYAINGKEVTSDKYEKTVPEAHWFNDIKDGWRMVKNNQLVVTYSHEEYDIYDGTIGDYPIILCFDKGKCNGFYFYKSRPENKFTLKCTSNVLVNGGRAIEVKEYLPDGKNTGTFKGKYSKGSSFSGTFTTSEDKTFEFYLSFKL